jgi:hypothetical protein
MRKKNNDRSKQRQWKALSKNRKLVIGCVCVIICLAVVTLAGPWSPLLGTRRIRTFFSPPPPIPGPTSPSKEYIYGGGRLIATEEPNPLVAPTSVVATGATITQINLSWSAAPNAHHYVVERATQMNNFTTLNSNVSGTTYQDSTAATGTAYLYRVRSADAIGNVSSQSNTDLATTIIFADDPLNTQTLIRANHIVQLRQAINAIRHLTPTLTDYNWQQPSATLVGAPIMANDIVELRNALDDAMNILGFQAGGYTPASLAGQPIQTGPITQLRDRVK